MRPGRPLAGLLAALLLTAPPLAAATPEEIAADSERLATAGQVLGMARAQSEVAALNAAIVSYEQALEVVRENLVEAGGQERVLQVEVAVRRGSDARFLAALEAARRNRPAETALHPQGPIAAARARAMLLRIEPAFVEGGRALADRLRALEATRRVQREGAEQVALALKELGEARTDLAGRLDYVEGGAEALDDATVAALLESGTLAELADALAGGQSAGGDQDRVPAQVYAPPVSGEVVRGFREPDAAGVRMPGLVWDAAPLSLAQAPTDGRVRYAGPFLDYQNIVVLETDDDALVLIVGLARRVVTSGDMVTRGAPLGILGGRSPDVDAYLMPRDLETGAGLRESLYVEIRHGRGPVDPVSWFDGGSDGGNG